MDFFAAQDKARRASHWLLVLFVLAVALSIGIIYLALIPVFGAGHWWHPQLFVITSLTVGGSIFGASLLRIASLTAGGGAAVALSLGGRRVLRSTTENDEKRLLNLVDEMAIAAGVPVPQVFILDEESSINAFAAGSRPGEAAIALTRGTLQHLNRDELQGVIAHEFSHILNGDMQLNLRLLGVLHGLFMLAGAGRLLLRNGARSDRGRAAIIALGLALIVAGYWGVLAGRVIRAATSRQREFLADASAVQFTRNPEGITSALRRIASQGSAITHPAAEEVSHMLFDSHGLSRWLATHPPIDERIRRLAGSRLPADYRPSPSPSSSPSPAPKSQDMAASHAAISGFSSQIGQPDAEHLSQAQSVIVQLPAALRDSVTGLQAEQGILALLLADAGEVRTRQLSLLQQHLGAAAAASIAQLPKASTGQRLPLLELALPTLRGLRMEQREHLIRLVTALNQADGRITLSEFIIARLLRDNLLPRPPTPQLASPGELAQHCAQLLSLMAHAAGPTPAMAAAAFAQGEQRAPVDGLHLLPLTELRSDRLDSALSMLAASTPAYRRRLIEALYAIATHDGKIVPREQELLTLICSALDCPHPIATASKQTGPASTPAALASSPASPDSAFSFADRAPLQALLVANLIPAAGVIFFDWDARNVLLLYWLENLVIGGYTLLRMLATHKWRAIGTGLFFSFHYSFFCGGHGFILLGLSGLGVDGINDPMADYWPDDELPEFLVPIQMLISILSWMANETPGMLGLPLFAFIISHGISAFTHHVVLREDDGRDVDKIMWDPYGRIFLLHIALIFGGFVIILSGGGGAWPILLLLITGKTAFDVYQHRRTHRKRQSERSTASEMTPDIDSD
jgi:Zn-dependent protease with chaperone function/uncharacterized tellurite resistance protein B-like protein